MSSRGLVDSVGGASGPFAALFAALDEVAGVAWWQLSEQELAAAAALVHRAESRCAAAGVAVLGEAVERGVPASCGHRDGARWYRALVPVTPRQAKARAGLAEALGTAARPAMELAPTAHAFTVGDISPGHASVLVRTMAAVAKIAGIDDATTTEAQTLMLQAALVVDPAQLGRAGQRLTHRLDPDAAERLARDEDAQHGAREAYLVQESTGMWQLRALLPPVVGAALMAALDPLAGPEPATDGTPDPRPHRVRLADAIATLAETSLAARVGAPGGLPTRAGATTRMIVTADLATLTADLTSQTGRAGAGFGRLDTGEPGGWEISPLTTQVLSCGAEVIPMLLDEATGRPLDVGRTQYPFPPAIRRAIEHRDQHCTFATCTAKPPWCHTHHLIPYPAGATSEANGALLCGYHHRYIHAHGWTGQIIDGHLHWQPPNPDPDDTHSHSHNNAHTQAVDRALHDLARRWHTRTHPPPDTG